MSDDRTSVSRYVELGTRARWLSTFGSLIALAGAVAYVAWPRSAVVVAPQCAGGPDCGVVVSVVPETAIVIALIAVSAAFALTAATGLVYIFSFGGGSVTPAQAEVKPVEKAPADAESVLPAAPASGDAHTTDRHALALWNKLPEKLQVAAAGYAEDNWGMELTALQLATTEVKRKEGRGNPPYWATFEVPEQGRVTLKLYTGGRGGGSHVRVE